MTATESAIPDGYHTVNPYLMVEGAARLLDFLVQAMDGAITERMEDPDGTVRHAEVRIGDSILMIAEARGEWRPMPGALYLYVPDTDATYQRAIAAGATSIMEPADQFYGDRNAGVRDVCGNLWWIATRKEDVSPDDLTRRFTAAQSQK